MSTNNSLIQLEGVTKVFYTDEVETHALAGIHLDIQRGEYISIAGPSVAVARAVGGSPSILLADEPTGNLDSKNGEAVMELLRELHREGSTICMVTHDPRYAKVAERSIHLFDGRVVEEDASHAGQKDLEESGFHLNQ